MLDRNLTIKNIRQHLECLDSQYTEENVRAAIATHHLEEAALEDFTYAEKTAHTVQNTAQEYRIISQAAHVHLAMHDGRMALDEAEAELKALRGHWLAVNPYNPTSVSSVLSVDAIFHISLSDDEALTSFESILESYPTFISD